MSNQQLITTLQSILGMLELDSEDSLKQDTLSVCDYLGSPQFSIAVFAPFNYGKSTLLNAVLGENILPMDLIPTTSTVVSINYSATVKTVVTFTDGRIIQEEGTGLLQSYGKLDEIGHIKEESVATIKIYLPHPFLKTGVELLDLPGTNDQQIRDNLVVQQLLTADLVIQVLDARKLMTLGEKNHLQDWLWGRGVKTVVFVLNFLNFLEEEEQEEVQERLAIFASLFRGYLPPGVSNVYPVNALPALRGQLKGDSSRVESSGLTAFLEALTTIVSQGKGKQEERVTKIISRLQEVGFRKVRELEVLRDKELELKQLLKRGFRQSVANFRNWLSLPHLLCNYGEGLTLALQQNKFQEWYREELERDVLQYKQRCEEWAGKGYFRELGVENLGLEVQGSNYRDIATEYLTRFHTTTLSALSEYEVTALSDSEPDSTYQLQLLQGLLEELEVSRQVAKSQRFV